jgi:site-specific recombinase XerD
MASVKVILATHKTLTNGEHPLWLRIIKDRKINYRALGYSCKAEWWDEKKGRPNKKHPNEFELQTVITKKIALANKLMMESEVEEKEYSAEEIVEKTKRNVQKITVLKFFDGFIERMKKANRLGNARSYKDARNAVAKFRGDKDFYFSDLDLSFLNRFEEFLLGRDVTEISISAYMRSVRSIYNRAIEEGYAKKDSYPFTKYKISKLNTKTQKRAITREQMQKIIDLKLEPETPIWHSKNYFLFSYYNMGINLIDIGYLKRSNLENGRLKYNRMKTGKEYNVKMLPPALDILEYYLTNQVSGYLFPILNSTKHIAPQQQKDRILKVNKQVNKDLKEIGKTCKIDIKLTTYVARHSWATILKRSGVSTSLISEAMKHDTEKTTQIYLDSFENDIIDEANQKLLE